jgi:hypothetical protein
MHAGKKRILKETLAHKLREPNTVFLLGGGASFCAGLPGIAQLTDLVLSKLDNTPRSTFEEVILFLTDRGIENPTIEEIPSELYDRLSGVALTRRDRERFSAIIL